MKQLLGARSKKRLLNLRQIATWFLPRSAKSTKKERGQPDYVFLGDNLPHCFL
ncbi:MAG: hypothetical protein JW844_06025 [Candidatus Omnitrophica bacterium]|nr:hypothetical protein [Candidatus Omnitrophota bacterium]